MWQSMNEWRLDVVNISKLLFASEHDVLGVSVGFKRMEEIEFVVHSGIVFRIFIGNGSAVVQVCNCLKTLP